MEVLQHGNLTALAPCGRSNININSGNCPWCEIMLDNGEICGVAKEDHVDGFLDRTISPWCWSPPHRRVNRKFLMDVRNVTHFNDLTIQWAFIKVFVEIIIPADAPVVWPERWQYFKALVKEVSRVEQCRDLTVQWRKTRQSQNWTSHVARKKGDPNAKVSATNDICEAASEDQVGQGPIQPDNVEDDTSMTGDMSAMGVSLVGLVSVVCDSVEGLRAGIDQVDIVRAGESEGNDMLAAEVRSGSGVVEEEQVQSVSMRSERLMEDLSVHRVDMDPIKPGAISTVDVDTQTEGSTFNSVGTQWDDEDARQVTVETVVYGDEYNRRIEEGQLMWLDIPEIGDPIFDMTDVMPNLLDEEMDRQLTTGTMFFSRWLGRIEVEALHPRFINHQNRMIRNNFKGSLPRGTVQRLLDNLVTVPGDGNCFWACLTEALRRQHPQWKYPFGQRGQKGVFAPLKNLVSKSILMMRNQIVCSIKWGADGNTPTGYSFQFFDHLVMAALKDLCSRYDGSQSELNTPFFQHTVTYQLIHAVGKLPHPVHSKPVYPQVMGNVLARQYLREIFLPRIKDFVFRPGHEVTLEDYMVYLHAMELDYMSPDEFIMSCVPMAVNNMLLVALTVKEDGEVYQINKYLYGAPNDICYLVLKWEDGIPTGHYDLVDPAIYDNFHNGFSLRDGFVEGVLFD